MVSDSRSNGVGSKSGEGFQAGGNQYSADVGGRWRHKIVKESKKNTHGLQLLS